MDRPLTELPYLERANLCKALDSNNNWIELAIKWMNFSEIIVHEVRNSKSPSSELLDIWGGQYGHTVMELFTILYKQKLFKAMEVLKPLVDAKYHKYIVRQETQLMQHSNNTQFTRDDNVTNSNIPQNLDPVIESAGSTPFVSYEELSKATDKWNLDNVLGSGGYGTVFRGNWKRTTVAIKRIQVKSGNNDTQDEQIRQSIAELKYLNTYRHENILPLYAFPLSFSTGGDFPCLVYQYMPGGSLDHRIRAKLPEKVLSWTKRLEIAIGIARGLQYLHTLSSKPLIHVDIKPANVLLDANDVAKIGDFGLARLGANEEKHSHVLVSRPFGTQPYLPGEFIGRKQLSTKVDIYSFGVVLFELATALPAYLKSERGNYKFLKQYVVAYPEQRLLELKDRKVPSTKTDTEGNLSDRIFMYFITFGKSCVHDRPESRPEMVEVLDALEKGRVT